MHVVPPNGFPNVPSFADLDRLAKQIENMPTFTSNDRAFLEELPSFPSEDGTKVLTATTESGETSLSYEEIENELPTNPSADGVKVLTATTESGETVLSWETPTTGIVNYSTTEQNTGQKWIDGKDIYFRTWDFGEDISISNITWTALDILSSGFAAVIKTEASNTSGGSVVVNSSITEQYVRVIAARDDSSFGMRYITMYYTKPTI